MHPLAVVPRDGIYVDGQAVAASLVAGRNDPTSKGDFTIRRDGVPTQVGPVGFDDDPSAVVLTGGGQPGCGAEEVYRWRDSSLFTRSAYHRPFGSYFG